MGIVEKDENIVIGERKDDFYGSGRSVGRLILLSNPKSSRNFWVRDEYHVLPDRRIRDVHFDFVWARI